MTTREVEKGRVSIRTASMKDLVCVFFYFNFFIFLQNKCVPYWPDLQSSKEVGPYVVTTTSEREAADYKIRVLEVAPIHKVAATTLTSLHLLM